MQRRVLRAAGGIRLVGHYSPHHGNSYRDLVILIHGWEGSSDSCYVKSASRRLYQNGFEIFRLNLRDHGDSHDLNEGFFWATNFDEVFDAVRQAAQFAGRGSVFLVGFSLGGNFALRIAERCTDIPIANLRRVVAVSPAMDPSKATDQIDAHPLFRYYFMKKWRGSLSKKAAIFPGRYDFSRVLAMENLRMMTAAAVEDYSTHSSVDAYFQGYTITKELYQRIRIPTTVITSADDPIIPVEDFYGLPNNPVLDLIIHEYGGHNGFIEDLLLNTWHERYMLRSFSDLTKSPKSKSK